MIARAGLRTTHMESNHFVWLLLPGFSPATFTTFDLVSPSYNACPVLLADISHTRV